MTTDQTTDQRNRIINRITRIEEVLENEPDLSHNKVMILAGEWKGLRECLQMISGMLTWAYDSTCPEVDGHAVCGYEEGMWAMLHRLRGI